MQNINNSNTKGQAYKPHTWESYIQICLMPGFCLICGGSEEPRSNRLRMLYIFKCYPIE